MKKSEEAVLVVKKFKGEKVFVLGDLRFSTFSSSIVTGGMMCAIPIRVYRKWGLRCRLYAESYPAGMGLMQHFSAPSLLGGMRAELPPDRFQVGERLYIGMPATELHDRIVNRLRELQAQESPWREQFAKLLKDSVDRENRLFKRHKRRITKKFEAASAHLQARYRIAHKRLYDSFLVAHPLPAVIRLNTRR